MARRRNWRAADPRGETEGRPGSVRAVVRHVHLGLLGARVAEAVLLCAAGTCVTLAAVALSGERVGSADAWIAAVLAGACVGLSWWLEHRPRLAHVPRLLDRKLRRQGALVAAWECEGRGARGPLARLLVRRELERLRFSEALATLRPSLLPPVAAPLVAAALLAAALEATRGSVDEAGTAPADLAGGVEGALEEAASAAVDADGLDGETVRELLALRERARELRRRLDEPGGGGPETPAGDASPAARAELEALDRGLSELALRLRERPALAAELEAARTWLDAARMALGGPERGPGPRPGEPAPGERTGGGPGPGLAAGDAEGTMARSLPPEEAPPGGGASDGERAEEAALGGRWWEPELDPVVTRWVEARRRALAGER